MGSKTAKNHDYVIKARAFASEDYSEEETLRWQVLLA